MQAMGSGYGDDEQAMRSGVLTMSQVMGIMSRL